MRILIVRYSSLGDVVIATSVIKAIHDKFQDATIDLLTDKRYLPVFEKNPYLSRVYGFERSGDRIFEYFRLKKMLGHYDILFDLQSKIFSILLSRAVARGVIYRFDRLSFLNRSSNEHILTAYQAFLKTAGIELRDRRYFLYYKRCIEEGLVGLNIEAGHLSKRLSKKQLLRITSILIDRGLKVALIGTSKSLDLARDIMCRYPDVVDTTHLDVRGLIETISRLELLITPDSGPMHIAAALGVPSVAIFGSTSYKRWLPEVDCISLVKSDIECSPCSEYGSWMCRSMKSFSCIRGISPDIIASEAIRLYESYKKKD